MRINRSKNSQSCIHYFADHAVLHEYQTVDLGLAPFNPTFDGTNMWVPCYNSNSIKGSTGFDLSPIGSFAVGAGSHPQGACSTGIIFGSRSRVSTNWRATERSISCERRPKNESQSLRYSLFSIGFQYFRRTSFRGASLTLHCRRAFDVVRFCGDC